MSTRHSRFVGLAMVLTVSLLVTARPVSAQSPLLEIGTDNDVELFQVDDLGGMVAKGIAEPSDPPATGQGNRLMWWPYMAALRAGRVAGDEWDPQNIGLGSVAMGEETFASGAHSAAFGYRSRTENEFAFAAGRSSVASGLASVALGDGATASGVGSIALGTDIAAQGDNSFAFGDTNQDFQPVVADNAFVVRAFGGVNLSTGVGIGCDLPAGQGAWSCTSSRKAKEGFEDVDGESLLARLAGISIQRWRYIGSDASHIGPTAEEFREAFGLGVGSTTIMTVDADGVALRAVQALIRRTDQLHEENAALRAEVTVLRAELKQATFDVVPEGP